VFGEKPILEYKVSFCWAPNGQLIDRQTALRKPIA